MLCKHGCKYMFFQSLSYYIENMASRSTKTWYLTHYHVPIRLPKTAHLIMMAFKFFSSSKMSKTGKNVKNPLYIRYNLKIRYIKKVKNRFSINWECCGQFDTLRSTNACVVPMLHAVKVALPLFCQQKLVFASKNRYSNCDISASRSRFRLIFCGNSQEWATA